MNTTYKIFIGVMINVVLISSVIFYFSTEERRVGAPREVISTATTTTDISNFAFTIGTTTPFVDFGTTTVSIVGSTTIQTFPDTLFAFRILNSVNSPLLTIDTLNASTSILTNFSTLEATTSALAAGNLTAGSCDLKASTLGNVYCGTDAGGGSDPFTWDASGNAASTTAIFSFQSLIMSASSSALTVSASNLFSSSTIIADGLIVGSNFNALTGGDYQIGGTSVLNGTTLGSGVTGSSLTSVGTLTGLTVSGLASLQGGFVSSASSSVTTLAGSSLFASSTVVVDGLSVLGGDVVPDITDGSSLGTSALNFSDLFLDLGSVINLDSGDITLTHSANTLAMAGGTLSIDSAGQLLISTTTAANTVAIEGDLYVSGRLFVSDVYATDTPKIFAPRVATSSPEIVGRGFGANGTSTITFPVPYNSQVLSVRCGTDPDAAGASGTTTGRIGDGTNFAEYYLCDDRPGGIVTTFTTNNTFTTVEDFNIEYGTVLGNPDVINPLFSTQPTR